MSNTANRAQRGNKRKASQLAAANDNDTPTPSPNRLTKRISAPPPLPTTSEARRKDSLNAHTHTSANTSTDNDANTDSPPKTFIPPLSPLREPTTPVTQTLPPSPWRSPSYSWHGLSPLRADSVSVTVRRHDAPSSTLLFASPSSRPRDRTPTTSPHSGRFRRRTLIDSMNQCQSPSHQTSQSLLTSSRSLTNTLNLSSITNSDTLAMPLLTPTANTSFTWETPMRNTRSNSPSSLFASFHSPSPSLLRDHSNALSQFLHLSEPGPITAAVSEIMINTGNIETFHDQSSSLSVSEVVPIPRTPASAGGHSTITAVSARKLHSSFRIVGGALTPLSGESLIRDRPLCVTRLYFPDSLLSASDAGADGDIESDREIRVKVEGHDASNDTEPDSGLDFVIAEDGLVELHATPHRSQRIHGFRATGSTPSRFTFSPGFSVGDTPAKSPYRPHSYTFSPTVNGMSPSQPSSSLSLSSVSHSADEQSHSELGSELHSLSTFSPTSNKLLLTPVARIDSDTSLSELTDDQRGAVSSFVTPPSAATDDSAGVSVASGRKRSCRCKKSQCLKLYCECFAHGVVCGVDCHCSQCHNTSHSHHQQEIERAQQATLDRDPNAFYRAQARAAAQHSSAHTHNDTDRRASQSRTGSHTGTESTTTGVTTAVPPPPLSRSTSVERKGCHCKKSRCVKKYCECLNAGIQCSERCKCDQCQNGKPHSHDDESASEELATVSGRYSGGERSVRSRVRTSQ